MSTSRRSPIRAASRRRNKLKKEPAGPPPTTPTFELSVRCSCALARATAGSERMGRSLTTLGTPGDRAGFEESLESQDAARDTFVSSAQRIWRLSDPRPKPSFWTIAVSMLRHLPRVRSADVAVSKSGHGSAARTPKPVAHVLVQPEMERGRSPLVSIRPFGRGFSRHLGLPIRCGLGRAQKQTSALRSSSR